MQDLQAPRPNYCGDPLSQNISSDSNIFYKRNRRDSRLQINQLMSADQGKGHPFNCKIANGKIQFLIIRKGAGCFDATLIDCVV